MDQAKRSRKNSCWKIWVQRDPRSALDVECICRLLKQLFGFSRRRRACRTPLRRWPSP
uniref:Uncharacterized protein n=1 Tax=Arundo donax TaxID=35708 RepID=A0A0A9GJ25_ARUDO